MGAVDILHGVAEVDQVSVRGDMHVFKQVHQRRPSYQAFWGCARRRLSPRALDREEVLGRPCRAAWRNRDSLFLISSKRSSEKSTRSILFTATITCLMPSSDTMNVCRRVWVSTP